MEAHFNVPSVCINGWDLIYAAAEDDCEVREYIRKKGYLDVFYKMQDEYRYNKLVNDQCCKVLGLFRRDKHI